MTHPQFRLFKGRGGKFYFHLTAANGAVILASQGYGTRASAKNGIKAVKQCSKRAPLFDKKTASNGKYYFVLTSPNGQTIGKSSMYASSSGRNNGIASVGANARKARVYDET